MLWGYMSNVKAYFPKDYYEKYGQIFGSIWVASAYKGAQGELALVTKMQERLDNHISWIYLMEEKVHKGILRFEGIALTGWSRYDHFLALCDLLPQAIPHLAASLQALKVSGPISEADEDFITTTLGCPKV